MKGEYWSALLFAQTPFEHESSRSPALLSATAGLIRRRRARSGNAKSSSSFLLWVWQLHLDGGVQRAVRKSLQQWNPDQCIGLRHRTVQPGIPVTFFQRHHRTLILHVWRTFGVWPVHQIQHRCVIAVLGNHCVAGQHLSCCGVGPFTPKSR